MSCRSTRGGTASLRLVRRETGLTDKEATSLFHALKREGYLCEHPSLAEFEAWKEKLAAELSNSDSTESQRARTQRDLIEIDKEDYDGPTFYALSMIYRRAKQEVVLKKMMESGAELQPPGAEKGDYELDQNGFPMRVWYASYGSNINDERFHTYLTGDSFQGQNAHSGGSRDTALPDESMGVVLNGRLVFASRSGRWGGGGIAFLDLEDEYSLTGGSAYSVSWKQLEDVYAQESGGTAGSKKIDWNVLQETGEFDASGLYGRVVHVGDYRGAPVITVTGSYQAPELAIDHAEKGDKTRYRSTNKPHANYIRTIGEGLEKSFGLTRQEQVDYFQGTLGGHYYTTEELDKILSTPYEKIIYSPSRPTNKSTRARELRERISYRSQENYGYRGYTPWWEDPDDEYNKTRNSRPSSIRDDEVPDWWWDDEDDSDYYATSYDSLFPEDWENKHNIGSTPTNGTLNDSPFASRRKKCVVCLDTTHDMHNCPWLEG